MPVSYNSNRITASSIKNGVKFSHHLNTERANLGQFTRCLHSDVQDEIPLNNFLNNCTRIWERDRVGVLFQGVLICLALLYHMTSGPSWAIVRAWTPLGRRISLALLVSTLDCSGLFTSMTHLCLCPCLIYFIINSLVSWS